MLLPNVMWGDVEENVFLQHRPDKRNYYSSVYILYDTLSVNYTIDLERGRLVMYLDRFCLPYLEASTIDDA